MFDSVVSRTMIAKDLLAYQFGNAEAIRRVAGSGYLLLVGAMLVLITSVPRNYDQTYIGETPWWPLIPLLFSFFSGSFLFFVLKVGFIDEAEGTSWRKYSMFMGLFWMTAPIAWMYGIPVERFLDGRGAAVANLWLLGIVSVWRVALMTRVMSVIYQVSWYRAGGWVLLGASLEVVAVLFFGHFGQAVGRGMAGMENSAEQNLIIQVLAAVFWVCLFAVPVLLILMKLVFEFKETARIAGLPNCTKAPWLFLVLCVAAWAGAAIVPQQELAKEWNYRVLLKRSETRDALTYLNTLDLKDWPAAKPFRPDPYEFEVWTLLPRLMEQVTGNEKPWVQEKLLWVFERTFDHWMTRFKEEDYLRILKGIDKLKGGEEWVKNRAELWNRPMMWRLEKWTNLVGQLEAKGIEIETGKRDKRAR